MTIKMEDPFEQPMREADPADIEAAKQRKRTPAYRRALLAALNNPYTEHIGEELRQLWNTYGYTSINDFIVEAHIETERICPPQFRNSLFGTPDSRRWLGDIFNAKHTLDTAFVMQREAEQRGDDGQETFRDTMMRSERMFKTMHRWHTVFEEVARTVHQPGHQHDAASAIVMREVADLIEGEILTPETSHILMSGAMYAHVRVGTLRDFCRRFAEHTLDHIKENDLYVQEVSRLIHDEQIMERITRK